MAGMAHKRDTWVHSERLEHTMAGMAHKRNTWVHTVSV